MPSNETTEGLFDVVLDRVHDDRVSANMGTIVILAILFLPGVIGNLNILHIYYTKTTKSTTRVFVIFLALIDLIACVVFFPKVMTNWLVPIKYYKPFDSFCRVLVFETVFVTVGEMYSLLAIAIDRYRRVCEPFKRQITIDNAKHISCLIGCLSIIVSIPASVLYGSAEFPTFHPNVTGHDCNILLEFQESAFEKIYYGLLTTLVVVACVAVPILYALTGRRIWKINTTSAQMHQSYDPKQESNRTGQSPGEGMEMIANQATIEEPEILNNQPENEIESFNFQTITSEADEDEESSDCSEDFSAVLKTLDKNYKEKRRTALNGGEMKKYKKIKRQIYMFTIVTVLYVATYVPYPLVRLIERLNPGWYEGLSLSAKAAFNSARGLLFLNNVINSYIYMIWDKNYRRQLKKFYRKLFCRR